MYDFEDDIETKRDGYFSNDYTLVVVNVVKVAKGLGDGHFILKRVC